MIWIVIPVHNRLHFTRQCLTNLVNQTVSEFKVIVVDDGSTDGTSEILRREFPEITLLSGNGSLFWTAAINMGIRYALEEGASHVLTLNNDTIPANDFVQEMILWSDKNPDAILSSLEFDVETGDPHYGGEIVNWTWASSVYLLDILNKDQYKGLHAVSLVSGRGMLIPRKVFQVIGLFDEKQLPHYLSDFDFTCLAKRKGFQIFCNYDAKLFVYTAESGDKEILKIKNIKNYFNHLFSIKGAGNLRNFTIYTVRNSPAIMIPFQLFVGYSKRILNYLIK